VQRPREGGSDAGLLMRARLIVQLPERLQLRLQRLTPAGGRPRQPGVPPVRNPRPVSGVSSGG
jgi:hypothetical protein